VSGRFLFVPAVDWTRPVEAHPAASSMNDPCTCGADRGDHDVAAPCACFRCGGFVLDVARVAREDARDHFLFPGVEG